MHSGLFIIKVDYYNITKKSWSRGESIILQLFIQTALAHPVAFMHVMWHALANEMPAQPCPSLPVGPYNWPCWCQLCLPWVNDVGGGEWKHPNIHFCVGDLLYLEPTGMDFAWVRNPSPPWTTAICVFHSKPSPSWLQHSQWKPRGPSNEYQPWNKNAAYKGPLKG